MSKSIYLNSNKWLKESQKSRPPSERLLGLTDTGRGYVQASPITHHKMDQTLTKGFITFKKLTLIEEAVLGKGIKFVISPRSFQKNSICTHIKKVIHIIIAEINEGEDIHIQFLSLKDGIWPFPVF